MVPYFGDFAINSVVYIPINTFDSNDPAASVTATNLLNTDVHIHKDGGTTQRNNAAGITMTIDFDSITGNHLLAIDTSDNTVADFFQAGHEYQVRVEGVTVDAGTINAWVGSFSLERAGGALALLKSATYGLSAIETLVDGLETDTTEILTRLPDATAGANGGLVICGSNAATTFATLSVTGQLDAGNILVDTTTVLTGNVTLSGTLGTGAVTLSALTVTNATTLTGAVSLGSTLGITGAVTLSSTLATGAVTLASATVTGALTTGSIVNNGVFTQTGTHTMSALTVTNALTAGSNAVPWNAAWDAEVQSECDDAITASGIKGATFDTATDSLEAIRNRGDAAWLTATGFSTHSAANVAALVLATPAQKIATDASGNVTIASTTKVDVETIKTQAVTCAAGVTVRADVGAAAAPGAANGMLIGGSNAATTFATLSVTGQLDAGNVLVDGTTVLTGNVTLSGTLGTGAVTLSALTVTNNLLISGTTTHTGAVTLSAGINAGAISGTLANDIITAASINTGALTADAFAADSIVAATLATGALTADAFAADSIVAATLKSDAITAIGTGVWASVIEGTQTAKKIMRYCLSVLCGKSSGGGTATIIFNDLADVKPRITATADSSGNRTAITLDGTD